MPAYRTRATDKTGRIHCATLAQQHSLGVFGALLRVDGLPDHAELGDPDAWYRRVTTSPLA